MARHRSDLSDEDMAAAIGRARGNLSAASDMLKVSRRTLYDRIKQNPRLKETLDQERERTLDELEEELFTQALSGNTTALIFALKTQGARRGYQEVRKVESKTEVTHKEALEEKRAKLDSILAEMAEEEATAEEEEEEEEEKESDGGSEGEAN